MKKLIKCGWLFDSTSDDCLKKDQEILINDNVIEAVGPMNSLPSDGAEMINLSGKFVMPGMIDCHVHLQFASVPGMAMGGRGITFFKTIPELTVLSIKNAHIDLMCGFTSIRNMGSIGNSDVAVRNSIDAGIIKGPRIYACGAPICAAGGHGDSTFRPEIIGGAMGTLINGPAEARAAVRNSFKYGADGIKLAAADESGCPEMREDEIRAVCEIAADHGKFVAAHTYGAPSIKNALRGGCHTIEHGIGMDDECIELMLQNEAVLVPTLAAWRRLSDFVHAHPAGFSQAELDHFSFAADSQYETIRRCKEAGIRIAVGSDASTLGNPHGTSTYEFELLGEAGLSNAEALIAGTRVSAEALFWDNKVGTIEPGKLADIIAFDDSPLESLTVLKECAFVMKDGEVFKKDHKSVCSSLDICL